MPAKKESDLEKERERREEEALEKERERREIEASAIDTLKNESEDYFEKNVTYISAGTLVLSLTFVEKIVNLKQSTSVYFLIVSWGLMALTLGVNLVSHLISSHFYSLTSRAIREGKLDGLINKVDKRNNILRWINVSTVILLFLGMVSLIIFCSINATTMSQQSNLTNKAVVTHPGTEQKGKTINVTASMVQPQKPAGATANQPQTTGSGNTSSNK